MQQNSILEVLSQRIPPNPNQSCPFISTRFDISCSRLLSITKEEEKDDDQGITQVQQQQHRENFQDDYDKSDRFTDTYHENFRD